MESMNLEHISLVLTHSKHLLQTQYLSIQPFLRNSNSKLVQLIEIKLILFQSAIWFFLLLIVDLVREILFFLMESVNLYALLDTNLIKVDVSLKDVNKDRLWIHKENVFQYVLDLIKSTIVELVFVPKIFTESTESARNVNKETIMILPPEDVDHCVDWIVYIEMEDATVTPGSL